MLLPFRSVTVSERVAVFADDSRGIYALAEATGPGWPGTPMAAIDVVRETLPPLVATSGRDRRADARAVDETCAMAVTESFLAARRENEDAAPVAVLLAMVAHDSLIVGRSKGSHGGHAVVLRGTQRHVLLEPTTTPGLHGEVVAFDLALGDLVLLATTTVPLDLDESQCAELASAPSLEAAAANVVDHVAVPGFVGPHGVIAFRVTHGRDAASVARRAHVLRGLPALGRFGTSDLLALAPYLTPKRWSAGEQLWWPGDPADTLVLLVEGEVGLVSNGVEEHLTAGSSFGESALTAPGSRRTFGAVARADCDAYVLSADGFEQLCTRRPDLALRLARSLLGALAQRTADFRWFLAADPNASA